MPAARRRRPSRRAVLALAALAVVAVGVGVAQVEGPVADALGGVLYAALAALLVALVAPSAGGTRVAGLALVLCVGVELAQLTDVPTRLVGAWPALRYLVGTTFNPWDLLAYAAGVVVVGWLAAGPPARRRADEAVRARPRGAAPA